jgi:hypothetical protein
MSGSGACWYDRKLSRNRLRPHGRFVTTFLSQRIQPERRIPGKDAALRPALAYEPDGTSA